MTTLSTLRELVHEARPPNPAGRCRDASRQLEEALRQRQIPCERHQGRFRAMDVHGAQVAEHFFISVQADVIEDYDEGSEVILDPTLDQFTMDYFHEGAAEAYVPVSVMPDRFIVYPDDTVYDAYASL